MIFTKQKKQGSLKQKTEIIKVIKKPKIKKKDKKRITKSIKM